MAKSTQPSTLILATLVVLLISSGCWSPDMIESPLVYEVLSPLELSEELRDVEFFLYKTGDFGSRVVVQNLALETLHSYETDRFINGVDLSSDGKYLIYNQVYRYGDVRADYIWRMNLETEEVLKIAGWKKDIIDFIVDAPSISADGKTVLFSLTDLNTGKDGLARVGIDGKGLQILDTTKRLVFAPEASPDGSLIVVLCSGYGKEFNHTGLCLLNGEGRFIRYIVDDDCFYGKSYFNPDGMSIVFSEVETKGLLGFIVPPEYTFYSIDLRTREKMRLLPWDVGLLAFSPKGNEMIIIARKNPRSSSSIYIMSTDGTNIRHLAYYDKFLADWYSDVDDY